MKKGLWVGVLAILFSCQDLPQADQGNTSPKTAFEHPPEWAKEVVWYEIAVERFRNGDPSNDPTSEDIVGAYPGWVPEGWQITPWTQDWYRPDPYFAEAQDKMDVNGNIMKNFVDFVQMRRYGGDLQGVLDQMDYIDSLGVSAVYFRPLNDAPSLHKYDARNWRHIDVNFGPDPIKDKKTMASEIPDEPDSWKMTEADQLFVKVIDAFHKRNIKVILDYSWNHTGMTFWAWEDVVKHQDQSKYKDWYWINHFDRPETPENEFEYHGWVGLPTLPEIKETKKQDPSVRLAAFEGNIYSEAAKQHIFHVAERWLDPNGDGDPSDGVDGYRLDVAAEMPLGFWRDFRKHVRRINPDAYLLGEIWWEEWPDHLLDPAPFLQGDMFDAVMNYRWYRATRHFFNESPDKMTTSELMNQLNHFREEIKEANNYAMMNYTGGYDTPRLLTSLFNKNKYKYLCKVHENPEYKIHKPDAATFETLKMLLVHQYTYVGAPHIYAGDEMGMWGADDPSSRKPLIWKDYDFEAERAHPLGAKRPTDKVAFNEDLFQFYQQLIQIRKTQPLLIHGRLEFMTARNVKEEESFLAYRRYDDNTEIIVLFNHLDSMQEMTLTEAYRKDYVDLLGKSKVIDRNHPWAIQIPARSACILVPR